MIELSPERIAAAAHADVAGAGGEGRPERAVVDSRQVSPGDLFFGLRGERLDGGEFAAAALEAGAWGVVVEPARARELAAAEARAPEGAGHPGGWILASADPLRSLQRLAREWRRALGCPVVGITGSTGKTSVKDICRAILAERVHASHENFNTEIGLPLAVLEAPPETEVLVLEMAMRGLGQIAELCEIAEPDVGAITNVGPVHIELLGTLEAIAAAKAEILAGLGDGGRAVVPVDCEALWPHLDDRLDVLTFGPGGDVFAADVTRTPDELSADIRGPGGEHRFRFAFTEAYNLLNATCAVAIGMALGASPEAMASRASRIAFSRLRGERIELAEGIVLVNDSYNANPVSMAAALEHLAGIETAGRRLAVLGGMHELGPQAGGYHRDAGAHARSLGIGPIVGVGELARGYAPDRWAADASEAVTIVEAMLEPDDAVLIKGSRAVGLEAVADELRVRMPAAGKEGRAR